MPGGGLPQICAHHTRRDALDETQVAALSASRDGWRPFASLLNGERTALSNIIYVRVRNIRSLRDRRCAQNGNGFNGLDRSVRCSRLPLARRLLSTRQVEAISAFDCAVWFL
jgi:hypothetical protein